MSDLVSGPSATLVLELETQRFRSGIWFQLLTLSGSTHSTRPSCQARWKQNFVFLHNQAGSFLYSFLCPSSVIINTSRYFEFCWLSLSLSPSHHPLLLPTHKTHRKLPRKCFLDMPDFGIFSEDKG